jgi:hypothetical protein
VKDASTHSVCDDDGNGNENGGPGHGEAVEASGSCVVCRSDGDDDERCSMNTGIC